jgi:hypothetical protein
MSLVGTKVEQPDCGDNNNERGTANGVEFLHTASASLTTVER